MKVPAGCEVLEMGGKDMGVDYRGFIGQLKQVPD